MNIEPFANSGNATFHVFENQYLSGANGQPLGDTAFNGTIVQPASNSPVAFEYFFIAAAPLAIITVMVPLLIVPLLTVLVRSTVFPGATWKRMHIGFWVFTFVLNFMNDILSLPRGVTEHREYSQRSLFLFVFSFMAVVFSIQLLVALVWISRRGKVWAQKCRTIRRRKWWIALWCCLVVTYYITILFGDSYLHFLNLLPFAIGFGALLWQYRRRRRRASAIEA